ncbi:hypothetical protein F4818DRAFT_363890 [Hypoxylon cercidicola]|nr:hypothetical protein F4818DRAFT_363890 [Hypoxylon cercidicola]
MMSFTSSGFWVAFFLQEIKQLSTLMVAVHLLPMAIAGLLWNIIAGRILHLVNNTVIIIGGSVCYLAASLLLSFIRPDTSYWVMMFPALILNVAGADSQFNVANVSPYFQNPNHMISSSRSWMYVMQSLPQHQQSIAGGIFNMVIRLANTAVMGISTTVFSSVELTAEGTADPMVNFTRTFQVSVGLSAVSLLLAVFIQLETQGNHLKEEIQEEDKNQSENSTVVGASMGDHELEEKKA